MKKIFCFLLTLFICTNIFAEDYGIRLFSWDKNYSDIISFYIDHGWTVRLDKESGFVYFTPVNDNYFYDNKLLKIKDMFFSFDDKGNITSQNMSLEKIYSLDVAFMACIATSIVDEASFYDQEYNDDNNMDHFYFSLHLADCEGLYAVIGNDASYMMFLSYRKN